jgi:hypothetical protein
MEAMTALDISCNSIAQHTHIKASRKGIKVGEFIDGNPVTEGNKVTEGEDSDENSDDDYETDSDEDGDIYGPDGRYGCIRVLQLDGIRAIAGAISDMEAMTKLDARNNGIMMRSAVEALGNTDDVVKCMLQEAAGIAAGSRYMLKSLSFANLINKTRSFSFRVQD